MVRRIQDAIGVWHDSVGSEPPRIVSLVPSITELLCELGLAPFLVGRTGFCIHPEDVVGVIPKVGGTKDVNIEKIRRLAPTHLIVNVDENEQPCVERLAQFVPHVVVTHPQTPDDNLALFRLLGTIFNAQEAAQRLCNQFHEAKVVLKKSLPKDIQSQRVLYCIWKDPWMTVSSATYIANMLAEINWHVVHDGLVRYPTFEWSEQFVEQVDLVLLSSEPYRFAEEHVDAIERQCGKQVMLVDGEMLSWYGSRAIAGLHYLEQLANGV